MAKTIEIKYNMEEQVWTMYQDKPKHTNIKGIKYEEYQVNGINHAKLLYILGHNNQPYPAYSVFSTKEELLASL